VWAFEFNISFGVREEFMPDWGWLYMSAMNLGAVGVCFDLPKLIPLMKEECIAALSSDGLTG
jgi:hypothetical protein